MADWFDVGLSGLNWLANQQNASNVSNNQNAANAAAANAAQTAAQQAVQQSRFTPVGMTNAFGTSQFTMDPKGQVSGASYQLNPYLSATQQRMMQGVPGQLAGAEAAQQAAGGLFNLGQQYLATSPEQASQQWMQQQQALLKPQQDVQMADLQNRLQQTGRAGLSMAQGGNLGAANPELQAYYNSLAQQNSQLAAQADVYGRERTNYGAGLFNTGTSMAAGAYAPLTSNLQTQSGINELGQNAFNTGVMLGGKNANPTGANALMNAGQIQAANLAASPQYSTNYGALTAGAQKGWF